MKNQIIPKLIEFIQVVKDSLEPELVIAIIIFVVLFLFIPLCFLVVFFKLRKVVFEMNAVLAQLKGISENIDHIGVGLIEFLSVYRIEAEGSNKNQLSEYVPSTLDENVAAQKIPTSILKNLFKVFKK